MKRVVLVGAGHVHRALLAHMSRLERFGLTFELVAPGRFWRGDQVTDLMRGRVATASLSTAAGALCRESGAALRIDRAVGLDSRHQRLWLASGRALRFDAVSINVGQRTVAPEARADSGEAPRLWSAASVVELARCRAAIDDDLTRRTPARVAILGNGPRALEIAIGLAAAGDRAPTQLVLLHADPGLLPRAPRAIGREAARRLAGAGVDIVGEVMIESLDRQAIVCRDGRRFRVDHVISADGYRPAGFVQATGLRAGPHGLYVTARLQAPGHERIFACGGCAWQPVQRRSPGPDSERQARVLANNLEAAFTTRPYRDYRAPPAGGWLAFADDRALGWRGRWHARGRLARLLAGRRR